MARKVRFTQHAQQKFSILAAHGFVVSEEEVRLTVLVLLPRFYGIIG
jgi:hypothetical protein